MGLYSVKYRAHSFNKDIYESTASNGRHVTMQYEADYTAVFYANKNTSNRKFLTN